MSHARAYLRASTKDQDANRAESDLREFAERHNITIVSWYRENESGATLNRPELFRLLSDSNEGDVLLIEQVDRLSRLTEEDWEKLKGEISKRKIEIVALDLPTSWGVVSSDETIRRTMKGINSMLLEMLAAIARKDYTDRRRRQAQGIAKARAAGKYAGRKEDKDRNRRIADLLQKEVSWSDIQKNLGCGRALIAKIAKRLREPEAVKAEG